VGLEIANPLVMRAEAIAERNGRPILARMPRLTDREARAALLDPRKAPLNSREPIRTFWANLGALLPNQSEARTFLVTSPGEGEGSPAVAAVLAGLIARSGTSVALMDADLERGALAAIVDGEAASVASVGQLLASKDDPVSLDGVKPIATSHPLRVLLANPEDRHLTEWLPPERLSALVVQLKSQVHALVISAPQLPAAETTILIDLTDTVIIAVAVGRTRRDRLTQLREALAGRDIVPVGYVALERQSLSTRISRMFSI
jgi:polysaccharide biosynthesis transport protein